MFNCKQQQVYVFEFSGGECCCLYLFIVFMANFNFFIFDEFINDLDIMMFNVLEDFLMDFLGCVLIVFYDCYFMDKIVEYFFVFEGNGKICDFLGSYICYWEVKKEEDWEKVCLAKEVEVFMFVVLKLKFKVMALSQDECKELKWLEKKILKLEEKKMELIEQFNDISLSVE